MGMFDTVLVPEALLPLPADVASAFKGVEFQSKSLHCTLTAYRITADGRFEERERVLSFGSEPLSLNPPQAPPTWKPVPDMHGYLVFYTCNDNIQPLTSPHIAPGEWFEFAAKFTDGRLVSLVQIPKYGYEPPLPGLPGVEKDD